MTIRDGSGLSDLNAVPPSTVVKLLIAMNTGGQYLDVMQSGLPIAGQSGTLAGRFTGDNAVARGHVWAKTGWIDTAYSLAGFLDAADGTRMTFAFYAVGDGIPSEAKEALDTLVTGVYNCGNNLASF
jgi:D-alanyl-D-alanine carboxypeptidase/D-alanyl-D-alanine-endopeptidase (penicillin-binding protein 4)